jgi:surfactin synthase thioesterase subunit
MVFDRKRTLTNGHLVLMYSQSPWFRNHRTNYNARLRLFCFPYAGGSALIYKDWQAFFPPDLQVISVELPGRGDRVRETPFVSLPDLIEVLASEMLPLLDRPFAFFGHSMGAVIAFELARRLRPRGLDPTALFVSGRQAPQIPHKDKATYGLPDKELIEELRRLEGTPKEVLENAELVELLLPLLRADFQLVQTYEYFNQPPLSCPIRAYGGIQDLEVDREVLLPWNAETTASFRLRMLPGDHFFLRTSQARLLELLSSELQSLVPPC